MKPKVYEPDNIALGGLDNDDVFATFSPLKLKGTGHDCKNEICGNQRLFPIRKSTDVMQSVIILSASDDSNTVHVKKKTTVKQKNTQKSAANC